jgi:hypothetical protein
MLLLLANKLSNSAWKMQRKFSSNNTNWAELNMNSEWEVDYGCQLCVNLRSVLLFYDSSLVLSSLVYSGNICCLKWMLWENALKCV